MRFLLLSACLAVTRAENVAMTSAGTAVFTSEGRLLSATPDRDPVQAQGEVDNFSDVAIDPANEHLVFALSTDDQFVCQFELDEAAGRLSTLPSRADTSTRRTARCRSRI